MVWIGLIWLRIGTSGGLLWTQYWTFGFHKMPGSSRVDAQFVHFCLLNSGLLSWAGVNWTVCSFPFIPSRPTEYRPPSWIVHLFVAVDMCLQKFCIATDYPASVGCCGCHGTIAWQWLFRVYSLPQIWVLSKRWLAMDVCSASDIPGFRQHATIYTCILKCCYMFRRRWAIFRQHTIKNEIYCTLSLSIVLSQRSCCYYRILFHPAFFFFFCDAASLYLLLELLA
jgi:hypothetical protein